MRKKVVLDTNVLQHPGIRFNLNIVRGKFTEEETTSRKLE